MFKKTIFTLWVLTAAVTATVALGQTTDTSTATPANDGLYVKDSARGLEFQTPSSQWSVSASKYSVSLNHNTHYDALVTLKDSWYTVNSAKEAYDKRKETLLSYLPGVQFFKENESLTLGTTPALSMTYKNPSDLKVSRELLFVHKGKAYELVFSAKEENFPNVKEDFGYILRNLKLF